MLRQVQPEKSNASKKILVVDDYLPTRSLIIESLSATSNYEIMEAENGQEALRLFNEHDYDLVISDIMMPGMSGMELLHLLRERNPNAAVIMITGNPTTDLTVSAIKKGAVDFLTKPFDIDDLLYKVGIHLREKEMLRGENLWQALEQDRLKDKSAELSKQSFIYDSIEDSPMDNDVIFNKIAELAIQLVDAEVCWILLFDEQNNEFYEKVVKGNTDGAYRNYTSSPNMQMLYNEVIERKEALLINSNDHPEIAPSLICAPLMIRNSILGLLSIRKKKNREVFSKKDLHHILSLTKRASLNLENKILYESIYFNIMDTLKSLISSIQARDHYTEEHSQRVAEEAVRLATALACSVKEIESIRIASILHDVGKIAIPDSILLKPSRLTDEEYLIIKNHSTIGENIVSPLTLLDRERTIIKCHHERWDGNGYPVGLKERDIPYLARILSVVDGYDAMTNKRPYRPAMHKDNVINELILNSNTQFDPDIVKAYIQII